MQFCTWYVYLQGKGSYFTDSRCIRWLLKTVYNYSDFIINAFKLAIMKKRFKFFATLIFLSLIFLSQPVIAQPGDAERLERCQNNKIRLAELEAQLRVIEADLSASMGEREMEDARSHLVYIKSLRLGKAKMDRTKFDRISALYNFKFQECYYAGKEASDSDPFNSCITKMEKIIAAKINKSLTFNRPELKAKKKQMDQQIATHSSKLITLGCDKQTEKSDGACKLAGNWTQDTPGIGSTIWEIKSDGTAKETGIGFAKGKATLRDNVLHIDWETNTGYSGYYEWTLDGNCSSGKGKLLFKTGRTDSLESTVKRN